MKMIVVCAAAFAAALILPADAREVRGAYNNAAGGITAGAAHDVIGSYGRAVGEGGAVTNGDGAGLGGSRGCARTYNGAGCRAGYTARGENGDMVRESSGAAVGRYGNSASTYGSATREDGYASGQRESELNVGDRTYNADTTFNSDDGFDRDVSCTTSSGDRC